MKLKEGIKETNVVVKSGADMVLPFAVVFGLYVILFGTVSPGGGFQGGVMVASACILIYLGYGYKATTTVINREVLEVNEALGAIIYVLLATCGLFLGVRFCQNVFYDIGNVGDLISAGTVTFMSFAVGYKVLTGVGFLLLLMLYLLGDGDEEEEVDEE
ncbi:MAG: cation:proton antiporter [Firmicutes bacterium]|nr:cation:proton antiporter [Bacillota bacterium]MBQ1887658.1 cation:proton antiporter [Bacillota bacterium]MBQ2455625.1 cation:proton antiporter [Bacillota bacterium]MBQ3578495.1 cation:proton antiporter [Bacillota bacterium]MBQ4181641.1 cation:proton antiporter [Bacillota bacterium]